MHTDQNDPPGISPARSAEIQEFRDFKKREAMEDSRRYEDETLGPFEECGVDEEDGPCRRSG